MAQHHPPSPRGIKCSNYFQQEKLHQGLYLLLLLLWLISKKDGARAVIALLKTVFKPIIIIPVLCLLGYAALLVYGLHFVPFWEWALLKDVVIWVLFVATPICFKAGTRKIKDYPFKQMVIDNFLWSAFLEFFVGAFTFSFLTEMIILPVFTFITILKDYDRDDPKHKQYQKIFDGIATVAGLLLLVFTAKEAITTVTKEGAISLLVSFSIPAIFSVAFLPIVYALAVTAKYHDLFVRLYIRNNISNNGLWRKKKAVFCACRISYKKLQKFEQAYSQYISTICAANDDDSFFDFVKEFEHT